MVICHMIMNNSCSSFEERKYKTLKIRRVWHGLNRKLKNLLEFISEKACDLGSFEQKLSVLGSNGP